MTTDRHDNAAKNMIKVGVACFIGAIVLYVAALFLAPAFKFLCLIAGFGAGYFAYEFRKVLVAIPGAIKAAWKATRHLPEKSIAVLLKINPWTWTGIIAAFAATHFVFSYVSMNRIQGAWGGSGRPPLLWETFIFALLGAIFGWVAPYALCEYGLSRRKIKFRDLYAEEGFNRFRLESYLVDKNHDEANGYVYIDFNALPLTERWKLFFVGLWFGLVGVIFAIGRGIAKFSVGLVKFVGAIPAFFFRTFWKYPSLAIWWVLNFLVETTVNVVLAVHKKERLICGVDSVFGGAVAWIYLSPITAASPAEHVLPAVCGGVIGAVIGMVNYRLVSVALLKFLPAPQ